MTITLSLSGTQENEESFGRFFKSENGDAQLWVEVEVYDDVSTAKSIYSTRTHERHIGGSINERRDEELGIGVESHFSSGSFGDNYSSYIRLRDANVFGFLSWNGTDELIELEEIGSLAVAMHQKWR